MSELLLTPFPGNSSSHVNGLSWGTPVFIYDRMTPLNVKYKDYPPSYVLHNIGDEIAYTNY